MLGYVSEVLTAADIYHVEQYQKYKTIKSIFIILCIVKFFGNFIVI